MGHFNPELDEVLADVDVRAIEALQRRWLDEERAGHPTAILDLCTEDVVWMPPAGQLVAVASFLWELILQDIQALQGLDVFMS